MATKDRSKQRTAAPKKAPARREAPSNTLRAVLDAALSAQPQALTLGMAAVKVPQLLDDTARVAALAAVDAIESQTKEAVIAAVCSVDASASAVQRVRDFIATLRPAFPVAFVATPTNTRMPNVAEPSEMELADASALARAQRDGAVWPGAEIARRLESARDTAAQAHGHAGPRYAAALRAHSVSAWLLQMEHHLNDPNVASDDVLKLIDVVNQIWRASNRLRPELEHTAFTAMLLVEAVKVAADWRKSTGAPITAAAHRALSAFEGDAPDHIGQFSVEDFIVPVSAWAEQAGRPAADAIPQWPAIAKLTTRVGCRLEPDGLSATWRKWQRETNVGARMSLDANPEL